MGWMDTLDPVVMVGQGLQSVDTNANLVRLKFLNNEYEIYHCQDCCESVNLYAHDMKNLIGKNIEKVEVETNNDLMPGQDQMESWTNTIYRFWGEGCQGYLHFLGQSNGYYGEGVDFRKVEPNEPSS